MTLPSLGSFAGADQFDIAAEFYHGSQCCGDLFAKYLAW